MTVVISCQQLMTADNSCWYLTKMKINPESCNLAHILPLGCQWKSHLSFFPDSCQQLLIADENENQLESWNLAHLSPLGCGWKFHFIFFVTAVMDKSSTNTKENQWLTLVWFGHGLDSAVKPRRQWCSGKDSEGCQTVALTCPDQRRLIGCLTWTIL